MSKPEHITSARLVDGKVLIQHADGSWREERDETDLERLRTQTDAEIERMSEEDDDRYWFPQLFEEDEKKATGS